jgi:hypothetical protein
MKFFGTVFFILAVATGALAQTSKSSDNPPDIQILKASWAMLGPVDSGDFTPGKPSTRMKPYENSIAGKTSGRVQQETDPIDEPDRRVPTEVGPPPPARTSSARADSSRTPPGPKYLYQLTVRNTGAKKIAALDWEYTFTDSLDQAVVGQHHFHSKAKISPAEKKQLRESTLAPPTRTINARTVENNPKKPFTELVRINRIEYADGSIWERASR